MAVDGCVHTWHIAGRSTSACQCGGTCQCPVHRIAIVTSDIQWYSKSQDLSLSREEVEEVEADEHEVLDALLADLLVRFWDLQISTAIKEWILHNHSWMCLEGLPDNEMKVCVGSLSRASCTPLKILNTVENTCTGSVNVQLHLSCMQMGHRGRM